MPRKIRAKTLSGLLGGYLERWPDEVAEKVAEVEPHEGSALIGLLSPKDAWMLLRLLPPAAARRWIDQCEADTLRRLLPPSTPADASIGDLQAAAMEHLSPQEPSN